MTLSFEGHLFSRRSAQAALEYLIVVGIALLLLTPITLRGFQSAGDLDRSLNLLVARNALNQISDGAKIVYFQGPPSAMTLKVVFPDRIVYSDVSGKESYFRIGMGAQTTDVAAFFDFPVTGNISGSAGERTVYIEALDNAVNITTTG